MPWVQTDLSHHQYLDIIIKLRFAARELRASDQLVAPEYSWINERS
jgi:hypothetical protein